MPKGMPTGTGSHGSDGVTVSLVWTCRLGNTVQVARTRSARGARQSAGAGRIHADRPWLLRRKVMLPDPVDGFVNRAELASRCDLQQQRLTVIKAPGGFGKTTLLADACHRLRAARDVAAWLTVDEEDDAAALATYLPFAFAEAGLDILDSRVTSHDFERGDYRINLLLHSIEVRAFRCVLAIDDVDRLRSPESLNVVDQLLHRGPPNLHIAMTCRELPPLLDVASLLLDRRGVVVSDEDLRFKKREIARFFDTKLSRRELDELNEGSQGWPIALCIHRDVRAGGGPVDMMQGIASNWIEARLWRGLAREEQDLVLDVGLFEWIDGDLVDEVLGAGSTRRIQAIPALSGLLRTAGGSKDVLTLQPLIRQYCAAKRSRESPERYRTIHRSIADALARRGRVVPAMRHAREAGDLHRVGEILEAAGGPRFWLRRGMVTMAAANELLTNDMLEGFPRLQLLRCILMVWSGELVEARATYDDLNARTDGFTRDREGGDNRELYLDNVTYRYLLLSCGCQPIGTPEASALVSDINEMADHPDVEPFAKAVAEYAMGEIETTRGNFEDALRWTTRSRTVMVRRSRYMAMVADFQLGIMAMVQGRVADAAKAYSRSQRASKSDFLQDAGPAVVAEVLATELNLERNRTASLARRSHTMPTLLAASGGWLDVYMASSEVAVALAIREGGPDAALDELQEMVSFAARTERQTLTRALAGIRISLLVTAGRTEEAQRLWADANLPQGTAAVVDLETQTWREMESIGCAALRLLTAGEEFGAARECADAMLAACAERGLRRSLMRCRALAMVLEHRAGNPNAAIAHLSEYLRLFAETDYARPMVQEREVGLAVLEDLGEAPGEAGLRDAAVALTAILQERPPVQSAVAVPALTTREQEILERLEHWRDKEIAVALDLSQDGVRYHVKKIYRKLGVRSRFEATRRARAEGILTGSSDDR